jgi:hypothetical protein
VHWLGTRHLAKIFGRGLGNSRDASRAVVPPGQLSSYTQLSSINYYGPPDGLRILSSNRHAGSTAQFITSKCFPLGILRSENHHYQSRPLAGRSCPVVAPPGQARRKHDVCGRMLVAAQLLHRRGKPDGSMTFADRCL